MDDKPRQRTKKHKLQSVVPNESAGLSGALELAEQRAADFQAALFVAIQAAKREDFANIVATLAALATQEQTTLTTITQVITTLQHMRKA